MRCLVYAKFDLRPLTYLLLALLPAHALAGDGNIVAKTDEPTFHDGGGGVQYTFPEEQYRQVMKQHSEQMHIVTISKPPEGLSKNAEFGFGFAYDGGGKSRSFVLDGDQATGYVIYLDRNANGDLTDDQPLRLEKKADGDPTLFLSETATETVDGHERSRVVKMRVFLSDFTMPGQDTSKRVLGMQDDAFRAGTLTVDDRRFPFALHGQAGIYDKDYNEVFVGNDGDGTVDTSDKSPGKYYVSERFINLAGRSFEFKVDHYGDALTLVPLAEKRPDRAVFSPGHVAPDFRATDTAGKKRSLSEYKGKVVLLEFWGIWCAPCVSEAPKLVETYGKYHPRGFEILAVHNGTMKKELEAFVDDHKMTWAQIMESDKGPVQTLYRVNSYPTYLLIGKDGKIVSNEARPSDKLPELLESLLGKN